MTDNDNVTVTYHLEAYRSDYTGEVRLAVVRITAVPDEGTTARRTVHYDPALDWPRSQLTLAAATLACLGRVCAPQSLARAKDAADRAIDFARRTEHRARPTSYDAADHLGYCNGLGDGVERAAFLVAWEFAIGGAS